jgi:uncharacterized protein YecT (DUF1311 family)
MNMSTHRGVARVARVAPVAVALIVALAACSKREPDALNAVADTMTTPTMRRELTSDLRASELALERIQKSVDSALGPELAIHLEPLRQAFLQYRGDQCGRLKAVFRGGTYGPVAELECMIHLTDSRREFIEKHYDFVERVGARRRKMGQASVLPGLGRPR